MFIAALFIIIKIPKRPKCLLMDEWIQKMSNIYKKKCYSAIKKMEILLIVTT